MKKQFSFITALLFMLLSCFFSFGELAQTTAKAAMPGYSGQNCIYYYCDLYASFDNDSLTSRYGNHTSIFVDHQSLDDQEFTALVNSGYFGDLGEGQTVIVDIKRFIPSSLSYMLRQLKLQGCNIILITAEYLEYVPNSSEVDEHHESDLERFKAFIFNSLCAIEVYGNANNLQFLLDNNMFNGEDAGYPDALVESCPYFKILYESLDVFTNNFSSINVSLLLHTENRNYVDLLTGEYITNISTNVTTYAFGCWKTDSDFYNHLINLQNSNSLLAAFMMEGDPILYGLSGLNIIDEFDLIQFGGWEADEASDLIEYIDPYIF